MQRIIVGVHFAAVRRESVTVCESPCATEPAHSTGASRGTACRRQASRVAPSAMPGVGPEGRARTPTKSEPGSARDIVKGRLVARSGVVLGCWNRSHRHGRAPAVVGAREVLFAAQRGDGALIGRQARAARGQRGALERQKYAQHGGCVQRDVEPRRASETLIRFAMGAGCNVKLQL